MNPNIETWQERALRLKSGMIGPEEAYKIRQGLMLVNVAEISQNDYQLLIKALD